LPLDVRPVWTEERNLFGVIDHGDDMLRRNAVFFFSDSAKPSVSRTQYSSEGMFRGYLFTPISNTNVFAAGLRFTMEIFLFWTTVAETPKTNKMMGQQNVCCMMSYLLPY
jgi:hypothetical protein